MRVVTAVLIVACLLAAQSIPFPGPGRAPTGGSVTMTFVQARAGGNDAVTSVASASASPDYAIGNAVVVRVGYRDGCSTATISVADDGTAGGNTYTQVGTSTDNAGVTCQATFYTFATKTADVVTASFTASVRFPSISVLEFNGPTSVDQTPDPGTGTNQIATTGSATTVQASEVFFMGVTTHGGDFGSNAPTDGSDNPITGCTWSQEASDPFGAMGLAWYCIASATFSGTFRINIDQATIVTNRVITLK